MSAARDAILQRIRSALADVPAEPVAPAPRSFRRSGTADRDALVDGFTARARAYKVRVERAGPGEVAATVARVLGERGVGRLVVPTDLPAGVAPAGFDLVPDDGLDRATIAGAGGVLTTCACAIAQTGTIVLDHGAGQGRRALTLLPDYHLCIVPADRIVDLVPEAVARMEPSVKAGRPLTFISGPSATSDIELSRVEGVHGPRTLDVIVVG